MDIDITTTTVNLPGRLNLLRRTLFSFHDYCFGHNNIEFRSITNIDNNYNYTSHTYTSEFIEVLESHFDTMSINVTSEPNFPKAQAWVWSQVETKYFFNLEDDWKLLRKVDLNDMIRIMEENRNLALLRLPVWNAEEKRTKQWNLHFPFRDEFFICPYRDVRDAGFSGNPSLIRKKFIDEVLKLIDYKKCPEKQIHSMDFVQKWDFGVYQKPLEERAIKDIGGKWRLDNGLKKNQKDYYFTHWVREGEQNEN